jgi:PPOX class probable F420-dependent enzyme
VILPADVCRQRFTAADRVFLATTGEDLRPHIVPVTFALTGDEVLIAVDHKPKTTPNLRRLRNITWNPRVSLLADHYAPDWTHLWWIRADGTASITQQAPIDALATKYAQYRSQPPAGPFIHVTVDTWTGWSYA